MTATVGPQVESDPPVRRGQVFAWGLWDWGSSAFNAVILTFVFTVYLTDGVGDDLPGSTSATTWLAWAVGLAGLAVTLEEPTARVLAAMAAAVYVSGGICWIASLAFRLTVVPWAAEQTVTVGDVPDGFAAYDRWAGALYCVHMLTAFVASAVLGVAVLVSDALPTWLGWAGVGWGLAFAAGLVATRFAGPFNPPFWAHLYTGTIGVSLLLH